MAAGHALLDFLLPAGCVACRAWSPSRALVCARCRTRLHAPPWPRCPRCHHPRGTGRDPASECRPCADWPEALTAARAAFTLAPPADDLVHGLKYEGWSELAGFMSREMVSALRMGGGGRLDASAAPGVDADLVVPVPTTTARVKQRGYNQAALLAEGVAEGTGLPLVPALVRRDGEGSQTRLSPAERRANVRGVFGLDPLHRDRVRGARAILVDDVLTTGATAGAAAGILAEAGVRSVTLVTFARALADRAVRAA